MAAAVGNRNILVGRPCMSLSTITPAWPSLASSPIRRPIPPSPSSGMRLTSSPATVSPSALCSPITAVAIAPITFAKLVSRWASNTVALALTRRKPMAKPNASSRPPCANGPTLLTGPTPSKETTPSLLGPTTTTMPVLMVAFTTSRPSAAPNQVQPLDHLQVALPCLLRLFFLSLEAKKKNGPENLPAVSGGGLCRRYPTKLHPPYFPPLKSKD